MELLLLLLLAPLTILSQKYQSASASANPNDQPFLPIYPIYPYSPKLIKRGTEHGGSGSELVSHLTPELYGPKLDSSNSYTPSYSANYQRDPYYPSYNPYPKTSGGGGFPAVSTLIPGAAFSAAGSYPSSYNPSYSPAPASGAYQTRNTYTPYTGTYNNPYSYTTSPYGVYNSYPTSYTPPANPYTSGSYVPATYPNYNYQAPYYYPNYYNQPYPSHPPPPPPPPAAPASGEDYSGGTDSDDTSDEEEDEPSPKPPSKKSQGKKNRQNSNNNNDDKEGQFVDGANFLSSGTKDLDGQSTNYKAPNPYNNQLQQLSNLHLRNLPIPGLARTTYRVISVGGQPVGPDYPLPSNYAKVQQLEQIMSQTLAKLLAQSAVNQAAGSNNNDNQYQISKQTDNPAGTYGTGSPLDHSPQNVIAKTGLAYVVDRNNLPQVGQTDFVSNYGSRRNPVVIKVQDPNQLMRHASTVLTKAATGKYTDGQYPQKSVTTVSIQQTPGIYIPPEAGKDIVDKEENSPIEYNDYDTNAGGQNYDVTNSGYKKNEQNYSIDQGGQGVVGTYHNSNLVTVQTPQAQNYQYSSYLPTQSTQQQSRDYKTSLDDVNFGTKRSGKV